MSSTISPEKGSEPWRRALRWLLVIVYFVAGVAHLHSPQFFMRIVPAWVPMPYETIIVTGLCEIAGAIALLLPRWRGAAGIMLALYAVCVYPANIKHAIDDLALGGTHLGWWYHAPRLALQPVMVWWALIAGGVTDWPFGPKIRRHQA